MFMIEWKLIRLFVCTVFARKIFATDSDVIVLTDGNFTSFAKEHEIFMFVFYVDWCTHCTEIMPEYELAAKILKSSENPLPLAKIDGMTQNRLVNQYGIKVYPKFLIRNRERIVALESKPTAKSLVEVMLKEARPAYKPINDLKELEAERSVDQAALLALTNSSTHPSIDLFDQSVRYADSNLKAFVCRNIGTRRQYNVLDRDFAVFLLQAQRFSSGPPTVIDVTEIYNEPNIQPRKVAEQILKRQAPLVGVYNQLTKRMYDSVGDLVLCIIPQPFSVLKEPGRAMNMIADQLKEHILPKIKQRIHWILVDELNYQKLVESFSDTEFVIGCKFNNDTFTMPGSKLDMKEVEVFARKTLLRISLQKKANQSP
ncbi:hypothetical protein FGIG_00609 [Fasciola gigantica]|uniref:Thioredoxin domain-containing protein n=1 Tax=Fasciola gigantica TaxID=46835 RepID=A0A504YQY2_FASGI|nr:hypothetical protein FGIG_00609 [Fasciola gigantica]